MLLIINHLHKSPVTGSSHQVIENKPVKVIVLSGGSGNKYTKMKVSLRMLLKTKGEKLAICGLETMLMKTNGLLLF